MLMSHHRFIIIMCNASTTQLKLLMIYTCYLYHKRFYKFRKLFQTISSRTHILLILLSAILLVDFREKGSDIMNVNFM